MAWSLKGLGTLARAESDFNQGGPCWRPPGAWRRGCNMPVRTLWLCCVSYVDIHKANTVLIFDTPTSCVLQNGHMPLASVFGSFHAFWYGLPTTYTDNQCFRKPWVAAGNLVIQESCTYSCPSELHSSRRCVVVMLSNGWMPKSSGGGRSTTKE